MVGKQTLDSETIIVGVGASAGGIQALKVFFEHVTADSGIAYVVILHLSPHYESQLPQILQLVAKIPVIAVTDNVHVQPDHVYVISPNQHLSMLDGVITTSENLDEKDRRAPVDIFFRTLAESHGSKAICVVLSGTGANGSMGLKRVKEKGGAAFVQYPGEAEFNEMPYNSIATGLVDDILPVAEIPEKIERYKNRITRNPIEIYEQNGEVPDHDSLREIFTQIRIKSGHDFSNYKRATIVRRLERRLNVRNQPDLRSYSDYLKQNPEEISSLLKDLLISVTNFFRDPVAFQTLEKEVLPAFLQNQTEKKSIRIWSAGCATGEEAYSIAMMCAEQTSGLDESPKIQIFATDIDEDAILQAREGVYTLNDAADVSPERLNRFFLKQGDVYIVRKEIREMVLFATHNFLKDPPFSHLDLVSCCNVLIYLDRTAQERVMETFHFALDPGGYLFLGSSESIEGASDLYSVFQRDQHFFQSRAVAARAYPIPDSIPEFRYDQFHSPTYRRNRKSQEGITFGDLHQRILDEISPASILINQDFEILHVSGAAGRFLQIRSGELSQNILTLILPEIRLELHTALSQVIQTKMAVEIKNQNLSLAKQVEPFNIRVKPVLQDSSTTQGYIVILFESAEMKVPDAVINFSDEPVLRQLDGELMRVKEQLKSSIDQHEFRAEELKASNEELQAMNEELRSAAEELETSKEELQSINEELRTVNQELKVKIDETVLSNNNLHNLINSSDIGTIFLDKKFKVAFFTPAVKSIFNLIASDRGRPLSDITHGLEYQNLLLDAGLVLENLQSIEKVVKAKDGQKYLMRLLPYRTPEDRIEGVVMTFVDITMKAFTEDELRLAKERLESVTDLVPDLLWTNNAEGDMNWFNRRWIEYTGQPLHLGSPGQSFPEWSSIVYPDDYQNLIHSWQQSQENGEILELQLRLKNAVGRFQWHLARSIPLRDQNGKIVSWFGSATDVDDLKCAQQALAGSEERYRIALQSAEMIAWDWDILSDELIWNQDSELFSNSTGTERKLVLLQQFVHPDDHDELIQKLDEAVESRSTFQAEFRISTAEIKETQWYFAYGTPISEMEGKTSRMAGVIYNITKRKLLENQKDEFLGIASHELKTPVTSIKAYADVLQEIILDLKDSQGAALVDKLIKQVDRLTGLINNLLDTTKIFEGQLSLTRAPFQINDLIRERVDELQLLTKKHAIVLKLNEDIPSIHADKDRIRQVLTNLISNAIKYSPKGGQITIQSEQAGPDLKISVRDEGIGIPDSLKTKVFDRFFRVKNPNIHSFPGMGLGLYIVAGIIRQHGGRILVDDKQASGTLIYFTLPIDKN